MPSTNKTPHLHLNSWLGTDIPKRADFVADNSIIDNAVYSHTSNTEAHLSASEKARVSEPFTVSVILGNGAQNASVNVGFEPTLAIMYKLDSPLTAYNGTYTNVNAAVATTKGISGGISISGTNVLVNQDSSPSGGVKYNLNEENVRYILIAFK